MLTLLTRRKRDVLTKRNFTYVWWRFVTNGARSYRAMFVRTSHSDVPAIARELTDHGIVVGPSDRFLTDEGRSALVEASDQILRASRSEAVEAAVAGAAPRMNQKKQFRADLVSTSDGLVADGALFRLALDEKLLEIVGRYLGLWPSLHAVAAWLNYPTDAPPQVSQLWHRDPEDIKIIKTFIYLADVDDQCGPFTYVPGTHPFGPVAHRGVKPRSSDERMSVVFPPNAWRTCTGAANTMILADTVGFHRGGKPTSGTRILITFTYTSGTPLTNRQLWIKGTPTSRLSSIQQYALKGLPQGRNKKAAFGTRG
jgi:hypothetical protein